MKTTTLYVSTTVEGLNKTQAKLAANAILGMFPDTGILQLQEIDNATATGPFVSLKPEVAEIEHFC